MKTENQRMEPTLDTTIRTILRWRPLAISILEQEAGYECWNRLDSTLSDFCKAAGGDPAGLMGRIGALPPAPERTDWETKPLYYLLDHLTLQHAGFRDRVMPDMMALLEEPRLPAYPDGYVAKLLIQELAYFSEEFIKHMDEEEGFLYPKIMRNEACFRHRELEPEAYKGSVNLYLKLETHKPEVEFQRMITSIREKLRNQVMHEPAAELAGRAEAALEAFETDLMRHADLENRVLFPRAGRLEQELYENSVPGFSRYPGDQ